MVLWLVSLAFATVAPASPGDIDVDVTTDGEAILVRVDCPVHASAAQAWEVLTDYDNMTHFLTHLEASHVEPIGPSRVRVYQKGVASSGPFRFAFENVREVEMVPLKIIRSRFVSGDLRASEFETELRLQDGELHILNRGRYVSNLLVPPLVGPMLIAAETRRQFVELREEIERRIANPPRSVARKD
ncbi:MAG TPA: SRPBCC family protein [Casimicrobiaceae bacterium]|nr:SRPBCC family protein [Casimicrobiaceae bacterium]